MYINNNRLSGDIDLGKEIDFTDIFDTEIPKEDIIITTKEEPKEENSQEETLEPISDCNNTQWKYGIVASCLALYFGLPLLFGNK